MGCDIHYIIEKKVEDKWIGVFTTAGLYWECHPEGKNRNYDFFGRLANVREYDANHPDPKGIPDDISDLSRMCISEIGTDGHSHSYCTAGEFCDAFNKNKRKKGQRPEHEILGIYIEEDVNINDLRVVFYFDN